MKVLPALLALLLWIPAAFAQPDSCVIEPKSTVRFTVSNLKINTVRGSFAKVEGYALIDFQQPESSYIEANVAAEGVDTGVNKRDRHLLETEFFDAQAHPLIKVKSEYISLGAAEGSYHFEGVLEVKGISRPLQCGFKAERRGAGYLLTAQFALRRQDFELGTNYGTFTIGEEVEVTVQLHCKIQ